MARSTPAPRRSSAVPRAAAPSRGTNARREDKAQSTPAGQAGKPAGATRRASSGKPGGQAGKPGGATRRASSGKPGGAGKPAGATGGGGGRKGGAAVDRGRDGAGKGTRPARPGGGGQVPTARKVVLDALERIETEGAYANLMLPQLLERSRLSERDRRFATDLVYGTTRMRRACDHLVDRFLSRPPVPRVRSALRLGAYQLAFADVPPHAAVSETVDVAPKSARGMVNAVLRRVSETVAAGADGLVWPDDATRLSVPDWIVARLTADLGADDALAALATMNQAAAVTERADGYVQDTGSQLVAAAVDAGPGERVLDACAAPGGKATALAAAGADVVAADIRTSRLGLVQANVARLPAGATGTGGTAAGRVAVVAADAARPPWRAGAFDRVLVDAPCSGLGTLRRRADLRWRVDEATVARLAGLQRQLVLASADLVRPGGTLVYSVCTLTRAESVDVDAVLATERPDLEPLDPPAGLWALWGRGAILLPQTGGTDGMCLFRYRRAPV